MVLDVECPYAEEGTNVAFSPCHSEVESSFIYPLTVDYKPSTLTF